MKSNNLLLLIYICVLSGCGSYSTLQIPKEERNPSVDQLHDTLFRENEIVICTKLLIKNETIIFENIFHFEDTTDISSCFLVDNYVGLRILINQTKIDNFLSFGEGLCQEPAPFIAVFKGDSIDNIDGYKIDTIKGNNLYYVILRGYFLGCNGSFCENKCLLIIKFNGSNQISKAFLFGYDVRQFSSLFIESSIIENEELQLVFPLMTSDPDSLKQISLIFGEAIRFNDNRLHDITNYGIFCIY